MLRSLTTGILEDNKRDLAIKRQLTGSEGEFTMANKNIAIGSIPKKDGLEIRATLTEYRNEMYVDLREFMTGDDYEGPTKKGIRFHSENWDDFFKLVKKIDQEIKKRA